ncbi:hypothetical protein FACS1894178_8230 [Bacteroidia bacterium]|nr:hypothetical protein FACS1894178_8230 [Bacteroidia bacterium]
MPIRLQNAENAWSEHNVFMKNSYLIGWGRVDTLPYTGFNFGWLSHSFKFQQEKRIYNDKSIPSGYYDTCYLNNQITLDSILNRRIENTLAYSFGDVTDYKSKYWVNIYAGVTHAWRNQIYDTIWRQYDSTLNLNYQRQNLDVRAAVRFALFKQVHISADASYDVLRNHSIAANGKIEYFFNQKHANDTVKHSKIWQDCINWDKSKDKIWLAFGYYDKSPDWFQRRHISNNYIWFNQFENEKNMKFEAGFDFWGMKISVEHSLLKDYIYMERAGFKQADEMFQVSKIVFEKNFKIWLICLDNRVVVQKVWNDKFMHLPLLSTKNAFYFDFVLARWTPTQIGIEMTYNTRYYADFYNPALQSFYVQNEFQTGNFFNVNAFIDLRVKRANVFLKAENLLGSWLQKNNYWYTAGYPTYSLWFKIGILWRFYD